MSAIQQSTNFPAQLTTEIFNKVKGHSSLAKMTPAEPVPFTGKDTFTFSMDHEISIVGEGCAKPAGDATLGVVQMRPIKVVYQSRVTDEFMTASEEAQLNILRTFAEGFAAKLAYGFDLMAMHGVNPYSGSSSDIIGTNHLDSIVPSANKIIYGHDSSAADANIEEALGKLDEPTGIILGKTIRDAISLLTVNNARKYPDFAWGATPATLGGMKLDTNKSVEANSSADRAFVGDFRSFRWGYAKQMPLEIIQYGDPDGAGRDLKRYNEILLRSEAFIGWAFMNVNDFARVYVSP